MYVCVYLKKWKVLYYFYMNTNILKDFHTCTSAPLKHEVHKLNYGEIPLFPPFRCLHLKKQ